MTVFEVIGFAWVVLCAGLMTAGVLIAAVWSITLGWKVAKRRYKLGESMERAPEFVDRQPTGSWSVANDPS